MKRVTPITAMGIVLVPGVILLGMTSCASAEPLKPRAEPSPPAASDSDKRLQNQELLDEALKPLGAAIEGNGERSPSFARSSVDVDNLTAEIMWKGEVPEPIRDLEGTTKSGVRITIVGVPYSQGDITAAAEEIFDLARKEDLPLPAGISATEQFDGLKVELTADDFEKVDRAELANQMQRATGIPSVIVKGEPSYDA